MCTSNHHRKELNNLGKFNRLVSKLANNKFVDPIEVLKAVSDLKNVETALTEQIANYSNFELLNNLAMPWYSNAREHYEAKLDQVTTLITQLEARYASIQAVSGVNKVQELQPDPTV